MGFGGGVANIRWHIRCFSKGVRVERLHTFADSAVEVFSYIRRYRKGRGYIQCMGVRIPDVRRYSNGGTVGVYAHLQVPLTAHYRSEV